MRNYGGIEGRKILYPLTLLVTFLHEIGHALGALITGGSVDSIQINQDGSGWTKTLGGNRSVIIMGGYLGSAIIGNILFYIGARVKVLVKPAIFLLCVTMVITGLVWYNSVFTTGVLILFTLIMLLLGFKTNLGQEFLMFIGLVSIIYIIQDFNVGPRSDLEAYAKEMVFIPSFMWMYIWLGIVVFLFLLNLRLLWKSLEKQEVEGKYEF